MVGSEGTLGVVTAACVRLTPIAPAVRTMLLDFASVEDCAATVSSIVARGVVPAALEMMDQGIVRAVEAFAHAGYPTDAAAVLLVEVDGLEAGVVAQAREVETAAREHDVGSVRVAADDAERALLWKGRKSAFGAIARIAPHYHLHDCVVPRTRLTDVLVGVYAIAERHDLIVTNVFHAGDGNLHPLFSFDLSVPGTLERVLAAADEVVRLCVDAGGALSGEHGIGLEKRDFMPLVFTDEDLGAQACVRDRVRPRGADEPAEGAARRRAVWRLRGRSVGARRRAPGGHVDLIHPHDEASVVEAMRAATTNGTRMSVVGGRRHIDAGERGEVDAELWTTALDRVVAYDPAEMLCVVESGMRLGELRRLLAEGGQEWPVDEPDDATVGGVIAADVPLPRQLRVGCLRDTVVEMVVRHRRRATDPQRRPHGQERHRLRPPPAADGLTRHPRGHHAGRAEGAPAAEGGDDARHARRRHRRSRPGCSRPCRCPAAVIAEHDRVSVRLEGWPEEVAEQARAAERRSRCSPTRTRPRGSNRRSPTRPIVAQAAVVPSRLADCVGGQPRYRALLGVGYAWIPCDDEAALARVRERVASLGGIAPVIRGPGGLGTGRRRLTTALGARLKAAFDPANILAPVAPGRLGPRGAVHQAPRRPPRASRSSSGTRSGAGARRAPAPRRTRSPAPPPPRRPRPGAARPPMSSSNPSDETSAMT